MRENLLASDCVYPFFMGPEWQKSATEKPNCPFEFYSHFNLIMWPVQRTHRHTQMHAHSAGLWVKTETQKLNHIILHQIIKYTILGWSKSSTDTKEKNRERKV